MENSIIKDFFRTNQLTKGTYNKLKQLRKKYHSKKRLKGLNLFNKKGIQVMHFTDKVFSNYLDNFKYFFSYGTLLGVIRDNKLLSGDMDLDMIVLLDNNSDINKFRNYLEKNSYIRLHSYSIPEIGICQDAFLYDDIMIDITYARKSGDKYINYLFYGDHSEYNDVVAYYFTFDGINKIDFEGNLVSVPCKPERYLKETYGNDWNVPNPNYKYWDNLNAVKMNFRGTNEIIRKFDYM